MALPDCDWDRLMIQSNVPIDSCVVPTIQLVQARDPEAFSRLLAAPISQITTGGSRVAGDNVPHLGPLQLHVA